MQIPLGVHYHHVYFRLDAGYKWGEGMDPVKTEKFFDDIVKLFVDDGWAVKEARYSSSCPTVEYGKSSLYLHPMDASGAIEDNLVNHISELLTKGKTFSLNSVDVYEEIFDVSDNDYYDYLDTNSFEIMDELKKEFTTTRKNLYISYPSFIIEKVKEKYHIPRLNGNFLGRSSSDIEWKFVADLFKQMVEYGEFIIVEKNGVKYYRTKKKGE